MTKVKKIDLEYPVTKQHVKEVLGYAVKNQRGYYHQLENIDEKFGLGKTLSQFESVGFINIGHTLKYETYRITSLGNGYYRELFGSLDYLKKRLSGIYERFIKKYI